MLSTTIFSQVYSGYWASLPRMLRFRLAQARSGKTPGPLASESESALFMRQNHCSRFYHIQIVYHIRYMEDQKILVISMCCLQRRILKAYLGNLAVKVILLAF